MQGDWSLMGSALSAGMVAFLNPCGFALLPSYISHYLGGRAHLRRERWWERALQGLALGGAVSAGFFTVFLLLGIAVSLVGTALGAFSGNNRIFLSLFALALPALLFFQIRHWERATQWLNGLLLIAAGGYLIYYQIFEYGVLR
jgi:cytochrome c biogenesis protein CcdA